MALTDNLISAWELNEASGNALDSHGSNTLTESSTVGTGTGLVHGTARDFEEANVEYFSRASNSDLQTGDIDYSVEAWVKPEQVTGAYFTIASKDNVGGGNREWILLIDQDQSNKFTLAVFNGASTLRGQAVWGTAPSAGTWYHVIAWHDATNNQVGIAVNDGTPVTQATSGATGSGTAPLNIGSANSGGSNLEWDGLIGPVRFWKRVLTSGERTTLYNAGAGLAYADFGGGAPEWPWWAVDTLRRKRRRVRQLVTA